MMLFRLIVTLGVCWIVKCDLLDLYVQHMDETMRTMLYRSKRHPMDPAARVKRSLDEDEPAGKVGVFKKQKLNFDKDWLMYWRANKKKYYENDALDIPNEEEKNLDPGQYEIISSDFEKTTTTTTSRTNASVPIEIAKLASGVAKNEAESVIPPVIPVIEERGEELEDELPVVQEQPGEFDELAIGGADHEETDSEELEMEAENEKKSQFEVIGENDRIDSKAFDDPKFEGPPKLWSRVPKKYSRFTVKLMKDTEDGRDRRVRRETESRIKESAVGKRSSQKQRRKPKFIRYEVLDEDGDVVLEWDPLDEEEVTFRVTGRTLGYVGIGFNEKSNMKGADLLLAWVDDHTGAVNLLVSFFLSNSSIPSSDQWKGNGRPRFDR